MTRLFLWLLLASPAVADDTPPSETASEPSVQGPLPAPQDALDRAVEHYLVGEHEAAAEALTALVQRADTEGEVPDEVFAEAMIYLGELQYVSGDVETARETFRALLERQPNAPISPYKHPLEVIGEFELVRRAVQQRQPTTPPEPPRPKRFPIWGVLPFGTAQFAQKQTTKGIVYASAQAALGAVSLWSYLELSDRQGVIVDDDEDASRRTFQTLWLGVHIPTTVGFYATWGLSVTDGVISWKKTHRKPTVTVRPTPGGAHATLHIPL